MTKRRAQRSVDLWGRRGEKFKRRFLGERGGVFSFLGGEGFD